MNFTRLPTRREIIKIGGLSVVLMTVGPSRLDADDSLPLKNQTDLSVLVQAVFSRHSVPGLTGAIVDLNGLVGIGSAGLRKIGSSEAITTNDKIHLGSDTKAMTATLIARRIESKTFTLNSTLRECFPKLAPQINPSMAQVTISQLLNHTAGLPPNVDWWSFNTTHQPMPAQRLAIAAQVLSAAPTQAPGTKYVYSNVGYMLLGAMIEADTGRAWEDVITDELFKPLEMTSAGFGPPGTLGQVDQPWGHVFIDGTFKPMQSDNAPALGPAGRVHCTMTDWAKFIQWVLRVQTQDTKILTAPTEKLMLTPAPGSEYAAGWLIARRPWAGGRVLNHTGSNTMWNCVAWLAPLKGFAVLAATNVAGPQAAKACDDLSAALIHQHAHTG